MFKPTAFALVLLPLLVTLSSSLGWSQTKAPAPDRWQLMNLMHSFDRELTKLRPYLVSEQSFKEPAAQAEIQQALSSLEKLVQGDRPATIGGNPSLNLNFSMMSYHLKRTKRAFEKGSLEYTRQNLNATSNFCISCHTQTPVPKTRIKAVWLPGDSEPATFESAEFLFITRRFDLALTIYDQLVRSYPKSSLKKEQLVKVYDRKVALFARVLRDPQAAIQSFKKDLGNKALPAETQANLKSWIAAFEKWQSESAKLEKMNIEMFLSKIRAIKPDSSAHSSALSESNTVDFLRTSGLLYEHLMRDPSGKHSQEILYSLAVYERQLSKLYWYSLHPAYLRECVLKYPKMKFTKACFDLYEAGVTEQYAGVSAIPAEVRSSIEAMRRNL